MHRVLITRPLKIAVEIRYASRVLRYMNPEPGCAFRDVLVGEFDAASRAIGTALLPRTGDLVRGETDIVFRPPDCPNTDE